MPRSHRSRSPRYNPADYRAHAAYFVTFVTANRRPLLGEIRNGVMHPSQAGEIVLEEWKRTDELRDNVVLDEFAIMPDHVHGILCLVPEGMDEVSPSGYSWNPLNGDNRPEATPETSPSHGDPSGPSLRALTHDPEKHGFAHRRAGSVSSTISGFKGAATRRIRRECNVGSKLPVWEPNFHDHILRSERAWRMVRVYLRLNPWQWWRRQKDRR